ncbi:hypothetical protein LM597_00300 [Candidatus Acetothermia bacterium]|nr:hypothetical protein [Candidatus Acetothermia bacterium]
MKKKFDAVKFQQKVREELSEKYSSNREAFLCGLKENMAICKNRRPVCTSDNRAYLASLRFV